MVDNRYGTGWKYGTSHKYGASSPALTTLLYGLWVDWDEDGAYPDSSTDSNNEAFERMTGWNTRRGRNEFLRDSDLGGFSPYLTGKGRIVLDNSDNRYNPLNTSSPLYPNVSPGRYCKLFVKNGSAGSTYDIFTGQIDDIVLKGTGSEAIAIITLVDGWRQLRDDKVSVDLATTQGADQAIGLVLDEASWPSLWGRDLSPGAVHIPYYWEDGRSPSAAIAELADSEYGRFWLAADGKAKFISRNKELSAVLTFTESNTLKDIELQGIFKYRRDRVSVAVRPRELQSTVTVWDITTPPTIPANDSVELWAEYVYNGQSVPVSGPSISSTDIEATLVDGGADASSNISIVLTSFGTRGKLSVTNAGAAAQLSKATIKGLALTAGNELLASSGTGKRNLDIATRWNQSLETSQYLSDLLLSIFEDNAAYPEFKVEQRPTVQFLPDLNDRITTSFPTLSASTDYQIGYIEHESIRDTVQSVRSTFSVEPLSSNALTEVALHYSDTDTNFSLALALPRDLITPEITISFEIIGTAIPATGIANNFSGVVNTHFELDGAVIPPAGRPITAAHMYDGASAGQWASDTDQNINSSILNTLAATIDGSNVNNNPIHYHNGIAVGISETLNQTAGNYRTITSPYLKMFEYPSDFYIQRIRVFSRVLTAAEVLDLVTNRDTSNLLEDADLIFRGPAVPTRNLASLIGTILSDTNPIYDIVGGGRCYDVTGNITIENLQST